MIFSVIRVKSLLLVPADTTSLHRCVFSTDMNVSSISNDVSIRFFGKRFKNQGARDILVEESVQKWCFFQTSIFCIGNPIVKLMDFDDYP